MGVLINKKAAIDDIVSDCRSTLTAAEARGGTIATLAQQYLKGPLGVFDLVEQRMRSAQSVLTPLLAQLDVKDEESDGLLGPALRRGRGSAGLGRRGPGGGGEDRVVV